nr:MAG TPA: hypothetical protein [Bacteriophage sp.]DAP40677.1 MAG TPA: hypothetical protein [Caudoviricetes sp.]
MRSSYTSYISPASYRQVKILPKTRYIAAV